MKLTITLTASEEANIRATQAYLRAHPQYIGVPQPPEGYGWNPKDPQFQPKNVLEEQTRERFDEIESQLNEAPSQVIDLTAQYGELKPYETKNIPGGKPGVIYTIKVAQRSRASIEISGSPQVSYGVSADPGVMDEGRTGEGAGTGSTFVAEAGEFLSWSYKAPQGGQTMRPQALG